ncbi:hypothetical protein HID58_085503 [Brassica napus]|uniref:Disease resistance protein n=3 Tax=Brassica TaxID=3705 RepID=A0ABQ7XMS6_BRANA|nr:hypothetical protein HID58_085503 [Brassica napus]
MPNLRFLRVYKGKDDGNDVVHIPGEMEFPRRLRLLHWEAYPSKYLPHTIHLEYLVELNFQNSKLEKLWEGSQPLANLKKMDLLASGNLKELPDLSKATKLEKLNLSFCVSLVEIPSSFLHLQKLQTLTMTGFINLEVMPSHLNLASLKQVNMMGCSRLRNLPVISTNIRRLYISEIEVEDERASIKSCSRLKNLTIRKGGKLKGLTHLPTSLTTVNLSNSDIERIPECIKDLNRLQYLNLCGCRRLSSLPELPVSLVFLYAEDCESLETVFFSVNTSYVHLFFTKSHHQTNSYTWKSMPTGKRSACRVRSQRQWKFIDHQQTSFLRHKFPVIDGLDPIDQVVSIFTISICRKEHLFIFGNKIEDFRAAIITNVSREMMFEFSSQYHEFYVTECGVQEIYDSELDQIFEDGYYSDTSGGSNESEPKEVFEDQVSKDDDDGSSLRSNPAKRLKTQ